jgi:uncharacterized MAPEG superfamily protein
MPIPVWVLLLFAGWTLATLFATVGVYRWSRILTGRAALSDFRADEPHGSEWYRRAMRAHANCVENLPVYAAVVVAILASGARSPVLDALAVVLLAARVLQTVTHVAFEPTNAVVGVRFAFFLTQIACMIAMGIGSWSPSGRDAEGDVLHRVPAAPGAGPSPDRALKASPGSPVEPGGASCHRPKP